MRILVIEAHSAVRAVVRDILQRAGHSVTTASDADDGAALAARHRFDLVISDAPLEAPRAGATARGTQAPPLLVLSGDKATLARLKAARTPHLAKPFVPEALLRTIERLFRPPAPRRPGA
jgi:DNA-binding response OmpR family regulator